MFHAALPIGLDHWIAGLPGGFSTFEGVVVKQREDCAVVGQQTPCYVDHPLALLVGLRENMETRR